MCANLRKLSDVSGLNRVLVSGENLWYSYFLFLLLMSLLIRDVAELEELSVWKSDEILPPSELLASKWSGLHVYCQLCGPVSANEKAGVGMCGPFKHSVS